MGYQRTRRRRRLKPDQRRRPRAGIAFSNAPRILLAAHLLRASMTWLHSRMRGERRESLNVRTHAKFGRRPLGGTHHCWGCARPQRSASPSPVAAVAPGRKGAWVMSPRRPRTHVPDSGEAHTRRRGAGRRGWTIMQTSRLYDNLMMIACVPASRRGEASARLLRYCRGVQPSTAQFGRTVQTRAPSARPRASLSWPAPGPRAWLSGRAHQPPISV